MDRTPQRQPHEITLRETDEKAKPGTGQTDSEDTFTTGRSYKDAIAPQPTLSNLSLPYGAVGARIHSIRSLASRTTLPHLSISSLIRAPNSSGVLATGWKPSVVRRSFTSGWETAFVISR